MGCVGRTFDPHISKHLLREEGEVIVDEVLHHWVVYVVPVLEALVGLGVFYLFLLAPVDLAWFPFALAFAIWGTPPRRRSTSTWTAS